MGDHIQNNQLKTITPQYRTEPKSTTLIQLLLAKIEKKYYTTASIITYTAI